MNIDGYVPKPNEEVVINVTWAGPGYFRTMRTALLSGRDFEESDEAAAQRYVIINEAMARRYWAGRDPLGTKIRVGEADCQVVGVAKTGKYNNLSEDPLPYLFFPIWQFSRSDVTLLVRGAGDPGAYAAPVRALAREIDPEVALFNVVTLPDYMAVPLYASRLSASFLGLLGVLALLLATVGLYSVMAYVVAQQTREIGIRMALGAQRRDVLAMVAKHGLTLTTLGIAVGLAGAFATTRFARSMLFGVNPAEPLIYLGLSTGLYVVAVLACVIPATRATRIDPLAALRCE